MTSFSQPENQFEKECGNNSCCIAYHTGFENIKTAWAKNQQQALDQEKATSEKIDDVFEGYNTYKCWAEYICRAVQFSGYSSPKNVEGGLTKEHLGTIPGCQAPEDLTMPGEWSNFENMLKDSWQFFVDTLNAGDANLEIDINLTPSIFTLDKISFIPHCMTDKESLNAHLQPSDFANAGGNYNNCMELFSSRFGCKEGEEDCASPEIALVMVETALKKDNANQKTSTLENKLSSILQKMHSMQLQTEYLKTNIQKLDKLYTCSPDKCD
ncbi:MAG: hypothetical protein KAQ85_07410 [Thermodesulfovibrionia bacterium]|nr:hypothetical protein [Thermodesulfovibrionia bacterium]